MKEPCGPSFERTELWFAIDSSLLGAVLEVGHSKREKLQHVAVHW